MILTALGSFWRSSCPFGKIPDGFRLLRLAVDSLYLSFPGDLHPEVLAAVSKLKERAQSDDPDQEFSAQYPVGAHVFEVKDIQGELKKGNKPATVTVNRYLATIRGLLRMARDESEWQWLDTFPKIKLLPGEVQRDRWLMREEAERLIRCCAPHLAALVRFALATGCRAAEITGLEWSRVDLERRTA